MARRGRRRRSLPVLWRIPDDLWELIRLTLPAGVAAERRPAVDRAALDCRWRFVRAAHGLSVEGRASGVCSGSTVHRHFQRWTDEGGGKRCGACSCNMPRRRSGASGCGSQPMRPDTKRHWVGKQTGPNPTDRAKSGTKRHVLTDGGGVPLAVVITAANVPDMRAGGRAA